MAWSSLAANQMVSFTDAQTSGFPLSAGQSNPGGNQCMDKNEILSRYAVSKVPMASYDSNQLVPKSLWSAATSTAFTFSIMYSSSDVGSCGQPNTGLTLYSDSTTLGVGVTLYAQASLYWKFIPGDGYTDYYYHSGNNTYRIGQNGVINLVTACVTSYSFSFSTSSSTNSGTACGLSFGLTLYASTNSLTDGSQVFTDAGLAAPYVGNAQYRRFLNLGGVSTVARISSTGFLTLTTLC